MISPLTMFLAMLSVKQRVLWLALTGIQQGFIKTSIKINNRYRTNKQAVLGLVREPLHAHLLLIAG